jgi:hypothetical protein
MRGDFFASSLSLLPSRAGRACSSCQDTESPRRRQSVRLSYRLRGPVFVAQIERGYPGAVYRPGIAGKALIILTSPWIRIGGQTHA